ncbi:MAG TPA: hypothetical protein VL354_16175 [Spirochaetia bacterium]|nr:hypothetical protein [Spirochaetia bacterium]
MGLLRKAASAVTVGDRNPADSAARPSQPSTPATTAGLLKRSIQILATCPEQSRADESQEADLAKEIVEASKALSDGVELPSLLFTCLRNGLSIAKGALLLYDPVRLEYAPWASHGLDQTTLHRMRIPLGANETFNSLANGEPLEVMSSGQRADFQRFFSSREFAMLERLTLCPYIFQDTLVGVLLVTEMHPPFKDAAQLLQCLKEVARSVSPRFQKSRALLAAAGQTRKVRQPTTPEEQVAQLLASPTAQGKEMLFLSLSLGPYIREVLTAYEDLDLFRLREDVRTLLDAFLADVGVTIMIPAGGFLVCLQGARRDDIPLFLHQLRYFLASHFAAAPSIEKAPLIEVLKSRVWPGEGTDVKELVSFLSS